MKKNRLKEWSKDAFQQSFYCNGAIFQCYCPAFATNSEKASEKQNQQPPPQKKQATEHMAPEQQAESTIESQQEQTDSVTITSTEEVACEIEAVQPEQDAQEMECHSSSEEETPENDTQTELASKIQKRQKSTHYFDLIRRQIFDEKTMLRTYPEAQSLIEEQHHIRIEDDNQKCLNELFLVQVLTEQEELFDNFKIFNGGTSIDSYYKFVEVRRRYAVNLEREALNLFCANLFGHVKCTFTLRKIPSFQN